MRINIDGIAVAGIAASLPPRVCKIESLADLYGEKQIKRVMASTGIEEVRLADSDTTAADLCVFAAQYLLENLPARREDIDAVVFVSHTPDYKAPATSCVIQNRLRLKKDVVAFDINYGCSAYIYGLYQSAMLLSAGGCEKVLLCVGNTDSRLINERDRALRVVAGDGGTATLLEKGRGKIQCIIKTDGSGYEHLIIPAGGLRLPSGGDTFAEEQDAWGNIKSKENLHMNGLQIMKFALEEVPCVIEEILAYTGWTKNEVGAYVFHQPNKLILDNLRDIIHIAADKMPVGLKYTGNTSAASIPLLLCGQYPGAGNSKLAKTIVCGFGIGFSWGAAALDLSGARIFPPVDYMAKSDARR